MASRPLDYEPPGARPRTNAAEFWWTYALGVILALVFLEPYLYGSVFWRAGGRAVQPFSLASIAITTVVMAVLYWTRIRHFRTAYGLTIAYLAGAGGFLPAYVVLWF